MRMPEAPAVGKPESSTTGAAEKTSSPAPTAPLVLRARPPITLNQQQVADAAGAAGSRADREQNQSKTAIREGNPNVAQRRAAAAAPALPPPAMAAPQSFGAVAGNAAPGMAAGAADMVVAANEPAIRVVGTRRMLGTNGVTRYEVAPGDTVELAEISQVQLESVVVTGMNTTRSATEQAKAPAVPRATAKTSAPPVADTSAAAAATVSPNGVNTIVWKDSAGRTLRLSGRHTTAELQAIRQKIEQLRAAADSARKNR